MESVVERFLRYVTFDTQSDEESDTCPSTEKQKALAAALVEEMRGMGIADARMDENGYVYGTVPGDLELPIIGLIAGAVATIIGLTLGLLAGYLGGFADDLIMFITNIFTVIPSFILLILISYSIGQEQRGAAVVALVIGLTSWTWTARSVRSQVISLRNRDHVNLSKLSGHSLVRIVLTDILPYIASYVVMAFILQVSSGILSEAQLSLLGLGPKTTEVPTLGLMMNWAMLYSAHTNGSWWAYFPVILTITLISFSLNLMNTGLDQVEPKLKFTKASVR